MKPGDRVKLSYGGGHVGVITDCNLYRVSFSSEGKPNSGIFTGHELNVTKEEPLESRQMGFTSIQGGLDDKDDEDDMDD